MSSGIAWRMSSFQSTLSIR